MGGRTARPAALLGGGAGGLLGPPPRSGCDSPGDQQDARLAGGGREWGAACGTQAGVGAEPARRQAAARGGRDGTGGLAQATDCSLPLLHMRRLASACCADSGAASAMACLSNPVPPATPLLHPRLQHSQCTPISDRPAPPPDPRTLCSFYLGMRCTCSKRAPLAPAACALALCWAQARRGRWPRAGKSGGTRGRQRTRPSALAQAAPQPCGALPSGGYVPVRSTPVPSLLRLLACFQIRSEVHRCRPMCPCTLAAAGVPLARYNAGWGSWRAETLGPTLPLQDLCQADRGL